MRPLLLILSTLLLVSARYIPRKSLHFGHNLPHAVFHTNQPVQLSSSFSPTTCPYSLAHSFVRELTGGEEKADFVLRKDSYTDKNTGVTHAYFRQLVNGLEVADGHINVNIKDGVILSYGNSFYPGPPPPPPLMSPIEHIVHPHAEYCARLSEEVTSRRQLVFDDQVVLTPDLLGSIELLHQHQCKHVDTPYLLDAQNEVNKYIDLTSPYHAVLQLMIAATPKTDLAQDIVSKYDTYMSNMWSEITRHLVGTHEAFAETIFNVPDAINPVKAKMAYVQVPHNEQTILHLAWKFEVEMEDNWYEAAVSATPPYRILSIVDWASDSPLPDPYAPIPRTERVPATYNVFKWGINDPSVGNRSIEKETYDVIASPMGWHSLPVANDPSISAGNSKGNLTWRNTTTTWGNNVFAHENWEGQNGWIDNFRPDGGRKMVFDYEYDPKVTNDSIPAKEEAQKYINFTITQLFYTSNLVHDLYYRYGFDEVSGNFQQHNFGRGGQENDAVIANAQDGSGYNNANFMTPPDGQNGRCRMYIWNTANPYRDGDLEAGIVIHELSHGLSTRLTGGPSDSMCLGWGESGGMGEGWGDFLATTIRSNRVYSDYAMGAWASNRVAGIRNYVYSLNETINPSTYKTLDKPNYWGVHAIGEVWAEMLWIVNQRLVEKHGYVDNLFPPAPLENGTIPEGDFYRPREYDEVTGKPKPLVPKHGNSLVVQLVLNGMKLQNCNPSFFDARDAIIQADQVLTGGENFCDLWEGFAQRGLGPDAKVEGRLPWGGGIRTNDFDVPLTCREEIPKDPEDDNPDDGGDDDGDDDDEDDEDWIKVYI